MTLTWFVVDISHKGTHFTLAFSTARDAVYDNDCLLYLTSESNSDVIVTIKKPHDFNSQGDQVTVPAGDHVRYDVGTSFMSHAGFNRNGKNDRNQSVMATLPPSLHQHFKYITVTSAIVSHIHIFFNLSINI